MAATSGNLVALQTLISQQTRQLNFNVQTIGGETPAIKAVMFCKPDSLSLLLAAGASTAPQTVEGDTVFTIAERMKHG